MPLRYDATTARPLKSQFMAIRHAVLLIADIGGYTSYMNWNRMHLAHAQLTVAELLESVIDAGKGLKLAKLEGDAAFFWAPDGNAKVLVGDRLSGMRRSFLARRERMKKDVACDCASCAQLDNLSLKFVAHQGEVASKRSSERRAGRRRRHPGASHAEKRRAGAGIRADDRCRGRRASTSRCARLCMPLIHDFEGIGETSTHYIDLATSEAAPTVPDRGFFGRLSAKLKFESAVAVRAGYQESGCGLPHLGRGSDGVPQP